MSHVIESILSHVCLDERVKDGIFKMDEQEHMDALRDYLVKKGLTNEQALKVTNRMVEGKYPERQAYRKEDGILVTWPSPKHKADAMKKHPGVYTDQDPFPDKGEKDDADDDIKKNVGPKVNSPPKDDDKDVEVPKNPVPTKVVQGDKELDTLPPEISPTDNNNPTPPPPSLPPDPQTPQRIAANKSVAQQIMNTDNVTMDNLFEPVTEICKYQLTELYKKAESWALYEACNFLKKYIK